MGLHVAHVAAIEAVRATEASKVFILMRLNRLLNWNRLRCSYLSANALASEVCRSSNQLVHLLFVCLSNARVALVKPEVVSMCSSCSASSIHLVLKLLGHQFTLILIQELVEQHLVIFREMCSLAIGLLGRL